MKRLAFAALVFAVAACGGETTVAERPSTATMEPVPTSRNIITEGVHDKRVVFVRPLAPATHPRDSVVVIAPSRATWLWLEYENTAYRWPVRPPV